MPIGVIVLRVLLVAGLAVAVASPSFVERRGPSFADLFERFRRGDAHVAYHETFNSSERSLYLEKLGVSHLRVWVRATDSSSGETYDEHTILLTPNTGFVCRSLGPEIRVVGYDGPVMVCHDANSADHRAIVEDSAVGALGLPGALRDAVYRRTGELPRAQRVGNRSVADHRTACFRPLLDPQDGRFELCFDDRGNLLYADVDEQGMRMTLEATAVYDTVDTAVFDR